MRVFEFLECFDLGTNVVIYDKEKRDGNLYDVGLVDIGKLKADFRKKTLPGSLAEEVQTESATSAKKKEVK